jgi:hypothetical protein
LTKQLKKQNTPEKQGGKQKRVIASAVARFYIPLKPAAP